MTLSGHELPAAGGDLPEARVELRAGRRRRARASSSGALSTLGIHPLDWLQNPTIVGTETVGGTDTTHIRASVNVAALLTDLNTLLSQGVQLGGSAATAAAERDLAGDPRRRSRARSRTRAFDVWTGNSDKTVRTAHGRADAAGHRQTSTLLGGLKLGRDRADDAVRRPQPAADDHRADERPPVQRVPAKLQSFLQSAVGRGRWLTGGPARASGSSGGSSSTGSARELDARGSAGSSEGPELQPVHPQPPATTSPRCRSARRCSTALVADGYSRPRSRPRSGSISSILVDVVVRRRASSRGGSGPGRLSSSSSRRCSSTGVSSEISTQSAPSNSSMLKISVSSSGESSTTTSDLGLRVEVGARDG